jgi:uroporphyrin-III C-methyltransferase / precorrin-2 dehydrogenase / sirohydrochlorin ferrochelatase
MSDNRKPTEQKPPRMGALARLPLFFALEGKRAVVAGGGPGFVWKAELLSAAGANVEVYTTDIDDDLTELALDPPRGAVTIHRRQWLEDDLLGAAIAIGGFDNDSAAGTFAAAARGRGVPVNVIDKPTFCDFAFGSIVNRSPLVIGISTDGAAPVFAQAIRAKLEALLPQGFALWAQAASRWRSAVKASGLPFAGRRKVWHLFTAHAVSHPNDEPQDSDLDRFIDEVRGLGEMVESGSVVLVGAGPGDPELLTLRAVRALQSADVILFDDLVSKEVLEFARREARKILVGKTGHGPACKQDEINTLMVSLARQGRRVVRLKGGDPLIFARADEEIAACRNAGIPVDIVPGITAAQGAASRLGVPLTGRGNARRVQFVTGHARNGQLPTDIDWRSIADAGVTTAVYMPVKTLPKFVENAVAAGLSRETPAVALVNATRPGEVAITGTVATLPALIAAQNVAGPTLVLIGNGFGENAAEQREPRAATGS